MLTLIPKHASGSLRSWAAEDSRCQLVRSAKPLRFLGRAECASMRNNGKKLSHEDRDLFGAIANCEHSHR